MSQGKDPAVEAAIEQEERVKACAAEVAKALDHYGCMLNPTAILGSFGIRMKVDIVLKPPKLTDLSGQPLNGKG